MSATDPPEIPAPIQEELRRLMAIKANLSGGVLGARLLAVAASLGVIYHAYRSSGFGGALVAVAGVAVAYWFGISPLFAIASSVLAFYFHVVGAWLPILSYAWAGVLLYLDWRTARVARRMMAAGIE